MPDPLAVAIHAAQTAGDYVRRAGKDKTALLVEQKRPQDYVSQVDRQAERLIRDILQHDFPHYSILGEELGGSLAIDKETCWVIDPLDGTTNFLRGIPHYAISIALINHGTIETGVVLDIEKQELFSAQKGRGASVNGTPIAVSGRLDMQGALLATGVPFSGENLQALPDFTDCLSRLLQHHTSGLRRMGAAALDLAYIAAGRYDGFWEAMLQPWDIAAGALLVTEAGGQVSDFNGGDGYLLSGDIIAASAEIYADMLPIVQTAYQRSVS